MKKITVYTESGPQLIDVVGKEEVPIEGRPNFTQMELGLCFAFGFAMGGGFGFALCFLIYVL